MKKARLIGYIITAVVIIAAIATGIFALVRYIGRNPLEGKWMDSNQTSGYAFEEDGTVTITYLNTTIPIINVDFNGNIPGTYEYDKKEKTVTVTYTVFNKTITKNYTFEVKENTLTLKDIDSGSAALYYEVTEQK